MRAALRVPGVLPLSLALALLAVPTASAPAVAVRFEAPIHKHARGLGESPAVLRPGARPNRTFSLEAHARAAPAPVLREARGSEPRGGWSPLALPELRPARVTALHSSFFQVGSEEGSESEAANSSTRSPQRGGEAGVRGAAAAPGAAAAASQRSLRPPGAPAGAAEGGAAAPPRPRGLDLLLTSRKMVIFLSPQAADAPVTVAALAFLAAAFALLAAWVAVCRVLPWPAPPAAGAAKPPPASAAAAALVEEEMEEAPARRCVCDRIRDIPRCNAAEVDRFLCKAKKYDCALSVPLSSRRLVRLEARVAAPAKGCPVLEAPFTRRACVRFSASASRRPPALCGGPLLPVSRGAARVCFFVTPVDAPEHRIEVDGDDVLLLGPLGRFVDCRAPADAPEHWRAFARAHQVHHLASGLPRRDSQEHRSAEWRRQHPWLTHVEEATVAGVEEQEPLENARVVEFSEEALLVGATVTLVGELCCGASGALSLRPWLGHSPLGAGGAGGARGLAELGFGCALDVARPGPAAEGAADGEPPDPEAALQGSPRCCGCALGASMVSPGHVEKVLICDGESLLSAGASPAILPPMPAG